MRVRRAVTDSASCGIHAAGRRLLGDSGPLSWNAGHRQGPAGGPEYLRRLAGQDMRAPGPGSSLPSGKGHSLSLSLSWPSPSLPATGCWSLSFCSSRMWGDSAAPRGVRELSRRRQPRADNVLLAGGPTCRWLSSPLASCLPVGAGTRGGSPRALSLTPPCSLSTQAPRGPRKPPGPQEQVCRPDMWTRQGQCPGAGSAPRGPRAPRLPRLVPHGHAGPEGDVPVVS